jgi:hypothetical protein
LGSVVRQIAHASQLLQVEVGNRADAVAVV